MTIDPGAVLISAAIRRGRMVDVRVRLSRPRIAPALQGRPAEAVAAMIPLIFAVCSNAHAAACEGALSAARASASPVDPVLHARAASEAARELVFAVCTGECESQLVAAQRCHGDRRVLAVWLESELLGMPADAWLRMSGRDYAAWAAARRSPLAREADRRSRLAEPPPSTVALLPAFASGPHQQGAAVETGSWPRQQWRPLLAALADRPLLQRWTARLAELVLYAGGGPQDLLGRLTCVGLGPGTGRALIETARGVLTHEVCLTGDMVERYTILAPTDWNFHPEGCVRGWLSGLPAPTEADALDWMRRATEALDPCVRSEFDVSSNW